MSGDRREALRLLAEGLPAGAAVPVPREWLLELLEGPPGRPQLVATEPEPLLTVAQAAARLKVTPAWLYKRAKGLPFAVKLSHKNLRFDPVGLAAWQEARRRAG